MTAAKTTFSIDDRSTNVVSLDGITVGLAYVGKKGRPFDAQLITTHKQLVDYAGDPHPSMGTTLYAAKRYLNQGNKLWLSRAVSAEATCGAVLVRGRTQDIPTGAVSSLPDGCLSVLPLKGGIKWDEVKAFTFPTYLTNREYEDSTVVVDQNITSSREIPVLDLTKFSVGESISILGADGSVSLDQVNSNKDNVGENLPLYKIEKLIDTMVTKEVITVDSAVTCPAGTELKYMDQLTSQATSFNPKVVVLEAADNQTQLIVNNSDLINPSVPLVVAISSPKQVDLTKKEHVGFQYKALQVDADCTAKKNDKILKMTKYEYEDLDSFMVYTTPGSHSKDISIGTEPSKNYSNAFWLVVYVNGVEVERFEVTLEYFVDGFNRQLYIEDKVNRQSSYVQVLVNPNSEFTLPVMTDHAYWLQNPDDVFLDAGSTVIEDFLAGHSQLHVDQIGKLTLGARIKISYDGKDLSEEFKIAAINSTSITLDRKSSVDWVRNGKTLKVYVFDATYNPEEDPSIKNGIQYYPLTKLDKVYPNNFIGDTLVIGGTSKSVIGTLVDTGTGHLLGGSDGVAITTGEYIKAAQVLQNRGRTPINIIGDGGIAIPAYAQALLQIAKTQEDCHAYLSSTVESEESADYMTAIVSYRQSLGIDDRMASLFCGWVQQFDEVNELYVWEPPSQFGINAQSYVTRAKTIFTPAAGYNNGMVAGLDVLCHFTEGEMDILTDNQINPIKYDNGSITIWGNETLLKRPSPLQLRSVNMLLIHLQVGVRSLNEYKLFDFNNESTWGPLQGAVDAFIRDEYKAKGGVYDYKVVMQPTDTDIDNRKAPLFIGIQPTMDIRTIPTTIAIYNKSSEITV